MPYVETDFFLAILKEDDWLKSKAQELYQKYQGQLWTSPPVITELLLICKEFGLDPEKVIVHVFQIVEVKYIDEGIALQAAHYIKKQKTTVFDALHAAYVQDDVIISSDKIYDKLNLSRIKLEEE